MRALPSTCARETVGRDLIDDEVVSARRAHHIFPLCSQNADPALEKMLDRETNMRSARGYFNVGMLSLVIIVLVGLFAGW